MAAPASYNLYRFAQHVKKEKCILALIGDSINTAETDWRMPVGYANAWMPDAWRGWLQITGSGNATSVAAGAAGIRQGLVQQFGMDVKVSGTDPATENGSNRYEFTGGTRAFGQVAGVDYDSESSSGTAPGNTGDTLSIPHAYREYFTQATLGNGVPLIWYSNDPGASGTTATAQMSGSADWATGAVTARLIYYGQANALRTAANANSLNMATYRNGVYSGNTATPTMTTPGLAVQDLAVGAGAGYAQLRLQSTGISAAGKYILLAGVYWYLPGATTGLSILPFGNAGLKTTNWTDTALWTNAGLAAYFNVIESGGPTAFLVQLGANPATGEDTDYAAGSYATFKTNLKAVVNRIRTISALNGTVPIICLKAQYPTTAITTAYAALIAQANYEVAREMNCAFMNSGAMVNWNSTDLGRLSTDPTDEDERTLPDGVHPKYVGAMRLASIDWSLMEAAYSNGPGVTGGGSRGGRVARVGPRT